MAEILILDDDVGFCGMLAEHIQRAGHGVSVAHTLTDGLKRAAEGGFDVVFLDIRLPDGSGLDAIPDFRTGAVPPEVIIITGFGDAESAELAIQHGAWDFIQKESSIQVILLSLTRALQYRESRSAVPPRIVFYAPELVGRSHCFRACLEMAAHAASSEASVLLAGETGTGKELFAKAIHENSPRSTGPFVVVDCTALPANLIGSLLFGHEKGAFTGADQKVPGLIKQAHGGTLFLDEIGDMPLDIQGSFLRVLQERRFRPLGARDEVSSDFRVVAATNRDLDQRAQEGAFRRDLLFRLRSLMITLPPLRDRMDDIDALAAHFVARECALYGGQIKGIAEDFSEALRSHEWAGNVRELANAVAGAVARAGGDPVLFAAHLPPHIRVPLARAAATPEQPPPAQDNTRTPVAVDLREAFAPLREMRDQFEAEYLKELSRRAEGNIESACQLSGLSRPHVYSLLKKHGLKLR
ncbi:MAG: sigma-54-dependent transcriptional regulator [Candidatus Hydrogenedentota bacterium]